MTYTPEQITAHIEHRAHCIGEDSKDVRILRQLLEECDAAWNDAVNAVKNHRYGFPNDFLNSCNLRKQHREDIAASLTKDNSHE